MKRNRLLVLVVCVLLAAVAVALPGCWLDDPNIPASTITRIYAECSDKDDGTVSQELVVHEDGTATLTVESASEDGSELATHVYELEAGALKELFGHIDSERVIDKAMKPMESEDELDEAFLPILVECGDETYVPETLMDTTYPDRVNLTNMLILLDELREDEVG